LHQTANEESRDTAEERRRHADFCDREPRGGRIREQADDETGDTTGYPEHHATDDGKAAGEREPT
jgi:hypothetical protein